MTIVLKAAPSCGLHLARLANTQAICDKQRQFHSKLQHGRDELFKQWQNYSRNDIRFSNTEILFQTTKLVAKLDQTLPEIVKSYQRPANIDKIDQIFSQTKRSSDLHGLPNRVNLMTSSCGKRHHI